MAVNLTTLLSDLWLWPELTNSTLANGSHCELTNLSTFLQICAIAGELSLNVSRRQSAARTDADTDAAFGRSDRVWQIALVHVPPVVALVGLVLNLSVLVLMPRRAVRVSRMAKFYYLVSVVGDIIIMLKMLAVFTIQASCLYRLVGVCETLGGHQIPWKVILTGWLCGEVMSNYAIMALNLHRVFSIVSPMRSRSCIRQRSYVLLFGGAIAPVMCYLLWFGVQVYEIRLNVRTASGFLADVNPAHPHAPHFKAASKIVCFIAPVLLSAAASIFILAHVGGAARISLALNRRRVQTSRAAQVVDLRLRRSARGSNRSLRSSSLVAVALSLTNVFLYLPTLVLWALIDLWRLELLLPLALYFFSLTGLAHVANFVVFVRLIPSFRAQLVCSAVRPKRRRDRAAAHSSLHMQSSPTPEHHVVSIRKFCSVNGRS